MLTNYGYNKGKQNTNIKNEKIENKDYQGLFLFLCYTKFYAKTCAFIWGEIFLVGL